MIKVPTLYTFVVPHLLLFFVSFTMFAIQTEQDTVVQIQKYRQEASNAILTQDYDAAITKLSKANNLVSKIDDIDIKAEVLLTSIELHYHLHNYEKAVLDSEIAIDLLAKTKNNSELGKANNFYGLILTQKGNYDEASEQFKIADELFTELNEEQNQSKVLLGIVFLN